MNKNVVVLLGINGVGKSTIARRLECALPGSVTVSGSAVLMDSFGGVNRQNLERLSAGEKMRVMEPALLEAFERHQAANHIILDTHLVVPIRKSGNLVLENVWSEKYVPYVRQVFFIISDPREIMDRRIRDFESTGRQRDVDLVHISRDQDINRIVFEEIVRPVLQCTVVTNGERGLDRAVGFILQHLAGESKAA